MADKLILTFTSKNDFYSWLKDNHLTCHECYIDCCMKKTKDNPNILYYDDAVEVALCFGWIDSVFSKIGDKHYRRFSPRKNVNKWSPTNIKKMESLINSPLMTKYGLAVYKPLNK